MGCIGNLGHGGHAVFGQKLLNTQHMWTGAPVNHPPWNEQMCWKSLQKKFTEAKHSLSQQHQLATDTDEFLEHSCSRGSLYYKEPTLPKITPVLEGGPPSYEMAVFQWLIYGCLGVTFLLIYTN